MFNTKLKIVSALLLLGLGFVFSHSELGQCEIKENGFTQHDYCEIVKGAATQLSKVTSGDLLKFRFYAPACTHFTNEAIDQLTINIKLDFDEPHLLHQSSSLYLFNRIFLI